MNCENYVGFIFLNYSILYVSSLLIQTSYAKLDETGCVFPTNNKTKQKVIPNTKSAWNACYRSQCGTYKIQFVFD
jgi:hypothetical protein